MEKKHVIDLAAEFIEPFEGVRLRAYQDSADIWTIGIGATGSGIGPGTVWTHRRSEEHTSELQSH